MARFARVFVGQHGKQRLPHVFTLLAALALVVLLTLNLGFFALHALQVVRYPFPLDYGEGPLLAQVEQLRSGVSLRNLYGPLDGPPYLVVNYPPVYLVVTWVASYITGNTLLAGRLVSLAAALACVAALAALAGDNRPKAENRSTTHVSSFIVALSLFTFLALPIVREWAVLLRVDLLGVALGLSALVMLHRGAKRVHLMLAALLLCASLFTKPSLAAAPCAALVYVLLRDWRRALELLGWLTLFGGAALALLVPGTYFLDNVVVANANAWQQDLAAGFWQGQLAIHGGLFLAGALGAALLVRRRANNGWASVAMPIAYTLAGAIGAIGVGKVGAYLNYFLELYAGLVWLSASGLKANTPPSENARTFVAPPLLLLVASALLWYYPTWSETTTKLAGLIEGTNSPRLIVGQRGVWQDLRRERQMLAVFGRTNTALVAEVQAAGGPILTDIPAIAVQAGQLARLQAFEHSQIMRQWDQRSLRLDLANGRVPLAVIEYLGNWLSPEVIALIEHRYAQTGSRGNYDLYRPIDPGPLVAVAPVEAAGLTVRGYQLPPGPWHAGETLPLTLLIAPTIQPAASAPISVVLRLADSAGHPLLIANAPLFYGALRPSELPSAGAQHMQPLRLPSDLAPGSYQLGFALQHAGATAAPQFFASISVAAQTGASMANGWLADGRQEYVPAAILQAWQQFGGEPRLGKPLMPAVRLAGFMQQCFERGCVRAQANSGAGASGLLPVGEWLAAGDIGANRAFGQPAISQGFTACFSAFGGVATLGGAVTNEFRSGERLVQYTEFARLERPVAGGACGLGAVGADVLRLPGGVPYRWP